MKVFKTIRWAVIAAAIMAASPAHAACTAINALPFNIVTPGHYCLTQDVTFTGDGISILADDVSIDLSGHRIQGSLAASTDDYCISSFGYKRISIRNGSIRGCLFGVYLSDLFDTYWLVGFPGGHHVLEDLDISGSRFRGIRIEGNANIIRRNVIQHIGGSTAPVFVNLIMIGIETIGPGAIIDSNSVHEVRGLAGVGEGVGIAINALGSGSFMRRNLVSFSGIDKATSFGAWPSTGRSTWGIWVGAPNTRGVVIEDNLIANAVFGITIHRTAQGIFARNTAVGALLPFYLPNGVVGVPLATYSEGNICDKAVCLETFEDMWFPL